MDVTMKWRTTFESGVCLVDDRCSGTGKFTGELDRDIMLYAVPAKQLLGSSISADAFNVFEALAVTSKDDYVNKLYDIFYSHPRRFKALVKSVVVNWLFDLKKVNPVSF